MEFTRYKTNGWTTLEDVQDALKPLEKALEARALKNEILTPKDLNAFIGLFEAVGVDPTIMKAVWKKNLEVRKERDWNEIEGAVS